MGTLIEKWGNLLASLDSFLAAKSAREQFLFFTLPVIVCGFLSYNYLIPPLLADHSNMSRQLNTIRSEISTYQDLLTPKQNGRHPRLDKLAEENRLLRQKIAEIKDLQLYTDAKRQNLSFIRFDAANWSDFLHTLVSHAKQNGITLGTFSNSRLDAAGQAGDLTKVLTVDFQATGTFYNMMAFIRKVESDRAVTEIEKLILKTRGNMLDGEFTIAVWGITE